MSAESRVKSALSELGGGRVRLVFIDYPPIVASIPLLKALVVSRPLVELLSDSCLKAVLAHELYHLTMVTDRLRLIRNTLHRLAGCSLLVLTSLLLISPLIYWLYVTDSASTNWVVNGLELAGLVIAFILAMPAASIIVRRVEGRLMRSVRLGSEEVEANAYAASVVGVEEYAMAVSEYSNAVRFLIRKSGLAGKVFKAFLNVTEALDPHPRPEEVSYRDG